LKPYYETEFDGGTIDNRCKRCGRFVKVPDFYKARILYDKHNCNGFMAGCYAIGYCSRCGKVELSVEFI